MNVLITLTTAGADTGPFNLYSNVDSYTTAFETSVAKSALVAGYLSTVVPASTNTIRVKSTGLCTNYIDIYVTGSGTTTTTTTGTPTTTTTTTQVVTYYNVVLCGTSTPGVIRHNGPNNVTLGVVVQSTNGQCYTISSVGTGPETLGTLLTQFVSCVACQAAPPPTTTTTSTSTSTSTTTSTSTSTTTSTSTSTTTTTTTSILTSCQEWRNDTLEEATITYTPCNTVTPVSNYALATTSSVCAVFGSITVTVGGPLTLVGSCNTPGPTTTTTTTTSAPPPSYYAFSLTAGAIDSSTACADSFGALTLYGSNISFLSNATFYSDYTLLSPYNGGDSYYKNISNNEYVQIGSSGNQTAAGSC